MRFSLLSPIGETVTELRITNLDEENKSCFARRIPLKVEEALIGFSG
jgi:hypothetical protein